MTRKRLLAIGIGLGIAGGTVALAQQGTRAPSPFDFEPEEAQTNPFGEPLFDAPSAPPDAETGGLTATVASSPAPSWNSIDFIDKGKAMADRAIQDLSAEHEALRAKLAEVEAELVRWQAIGRALAGAKETGPPTGPGIAPPVDGPELIPLPDPSSEESPPRTGRARPDLDSPF